MKRRRTAKKDEKEAKTNFHFHFRPGGEIRQEFYGSYDETLLRVATDLRKEVYEILLPMRLQN